MNNNFTNSWAVNSQNRVGNRPSGEAWNHDFPSYIDFDEEACVDRLLIEAFGSSIEDGVAAWRAQVAASSEEESTLTRSSNWRSVTTRMVCWKRRD